LSEYYYGLIDRGWPLPYKIFRMWNIEGGHCQDIIMGWLAGDGHWQLLFGNMSILVEYYYMLVNRGWPLPYKIFRGWDTEGGHCQNIIMD
jgi:hypothetical protein